MNRSMNLPAIQRIMRDFERESATMDMKDEMMGDAVDEAMDDEADGVGEEEESDNILKEVLDEIGVSVGQQVSLVAANTYRHAQHALIDTCSQRNSSEKRPQQACPLHRRCPSSESRSAKAHPEVLEGPRWAVEEAVAARARRMLSRRGSTICGATDLTTPGSGYVGRPLFPFFVFPFVCSRSIMMLSYPKIVLRSLLM